MNALNTTENTKTKKVHLYYILIISDYNLCRESNKRSLNKVNILKTGFSQYTHVHVLFFLDT